jgi:hypothetical protein
MLNNTKEMEVEDHNVIGRVEHSEESKKNFLLRRTYIYRT